MTSTVHHWAQGPLDVWPYRDWDAEMECWAFRYWIEDRNAVPGYTPTMLSETVWHILNRYPRAWGRSGVDFIEVSNLRNCEIVLRLTDAPPPDWPDLPPGLGWYYHDSKLDKNVAQVTAQRWVWDNTTYLAAILGMELCGHGCFRMWDMYLPAHEPYEGAMGSWEAMLRAGGFPSDAEIEAAKAWLRGEAQVVDRHEEFTVPTVGGEQHVG